MRAFKNLTFFRVVHAEHYRDKLTACVGCYNAQIFLGLPPGHVLVKEVQTEQIKENEWNLISRLQILYTEQEGERADFFDGWFGAQVEVIDV